MKWAVKSDPQQIRSCMHTYMHYIHTCITCIHAYIFIISLYHYITIHIVHNIYIFVYIYFLAYFFSGFYWESRHGHGTAVPLRSYPAEGFPISGDGGALLWRSTEKRWLNHSYGFFSNRNPMCVFFRIFFFNRNPMIFFRNI